MNITIDDNNMAYESNSYTHDELVEMQNYAIFRMNSYLDKSYEKEDKKIKKMRNNIIKKSTE